ncbi:MAG: pantoate--beta-alanine ligase [Ktedonobacteraceae bacterium]
MRVITTVQEMIDVRATWTATQSVGLVPTMGYLHTGHLSLVHQARMENDILLVSIFVNPTQFGPHEDLMHYPRDLPRDLEMLEACGVDAVFVPTPADMYPPDFATYVEPTGLLVTGAEGASRPGHFRGVATVVLKLFLISRPQQAYFGQKDAQQVAVITRMLDDLNLPIILRRLPTIREADGLAMSSRNAYLTPSARTAAIVLYRALLAGKQAFDSANTTDPHDVVRAMQQVVANEPEATLDYAEMRDPYTFLPLERLRVPALLLIAVSLGSTRLIDNFWLQRDGMWNIGTRQE